MRILGVFAHPDDESFCAGGTFARHVSNGAEVMVVSATRGEAGQIRSAGVATCRTLGHVRKQEFHLACRQLGVQHAICLDLGDGMLMELEPDLLTGQVCEIIQPDMLPLSIFRELMGREYFVPVSLVSEVEPQLLALQIA